MTRILIFIALFVFLITRATAQTPMTDQAVARGVYFPIYGSGHSGVPIALVDLDNDGDLDLMVGGGVLGALGLYANNGFGYFSNVTAGAGLPADPDFSSASGADYDADGDVDIYLSAFGPPNELLINDGDLTFTLAPESSGVRDTGLGMGSAWGDYNADGWPDLYLCNHVTPGYGNNRLFRNLGNGSFVDVAAGLGVDSSSTHFHARFLDYDRDGDADLYVGTDRGVTLGVTNTLWRNDGGTYVDVSLATATGISEDSMGLGIGDFDSNGFPDIFVSNRFPMGGNVLLMNMGSNFVDSSLLYGITPVIVGWGTAVFDFNNNGREDVFVADSGDTSHFFLGATTPPMTEMAALVGLDDIVSAYCAVPGDVDGDGDVDLIVQEANQLLSLFINNSPPLAANRLKIRLSGPWPNTFGIGASVEVTAGGVTQLRQMLGSGSYRDATPYELYFGLGSNALADSVRVYWPTSPMTELTSVPVNQSLLIDAPPQTLLRNFVRGDSNDDGNVDIADAINLLALLFTSGIGLCSAAEDANSDYGQYCRPDHIADPLVLRRTATPTTGILRGPTCERTRVRRVQLL
ncbi:MAG: CRTAC1 family protein [Planctomycetota bacterium]